MSACLVKRPYSRLTYHHVRLRAFPDVYKEQQR
jgi:hypothetical protein